jgi:hypothetical protein
VNSVNSGAMLHYRTVHINNFFFLKNQCEWINSLALFTWNV